jgi:DNA-binding transcriptional ArsR family regulator
MVPLCSDFLFKTLSDPMRRSIFERLTRDGALTVNAPTRQSGVSQPAVSKHLGMLKLADLFAIDVTVVRPITLLTRRDWRP